MDSAIEPGREWGGTLGDVSISSIASEDEAVIERILFHAAPFGQTQESANFITYAIDCVEPWNQIDTEFGDERRQP
jgi:hypothetical protein